MAAAIYERLAIIGHGHIGSSVSRAVRRHGLAGRIVAADPDPQVRRRSVELGLVDRMFQDPAAAVADADCVVIGAPVGACGAVAQAMAAGLKPGCTVTDTGSVKAAVIEAVAPHLPAGVHFIPGHPIAGTENSGPDSGFAELFEGRYWLLTPPDGADPAAIRRLTALWSGIGSIVECMDARYHDRVLATTSHLPHLIAYTIVGTAFDLEAQEQRDVIRFSAGGFRDFTRIAASDPVMWRDVFLNNRDAVLEMLQRFTEDLTALQRSIRWGEGERLQDLFTRTREIRRGVIDARQEGASPWDRPQTGQPPGAGE